MNEWGKWDEWGKWNEWDKRDKHQKRDRQKTNLCLKRCMVSKPHQGGVRLQRGGSRRHLRGRTALQADTKGVATIRGRYPRLLTVQPSRLDSLAGSRAMRSLYFQPVCGSRRHLRGRTALQADTKGVATIRGRCPRLLTVQPSRLDSLAGPRAMRSLCFQPVCGSRRHLRGRTALQANLSLPSAIPGRCPGLLTV